MDLYLSVLASILVVLIISYLIKIWNSYQYFTRKGIAGPKPTYFVGNFLEITKNKNLSEVIHKWTQKYGKVFGYYQGHLPILVTSDLSLVEEIFIKQYSNFSARKMGHLDRSDNSPYASLFNAVRGRWKRMRNIMNPTFSSSKLKELNPLIVKCTDRLLSKISAMNENENEVAELYKRFTMDTIWNCAFGIDTDLQNDLNNQYFYRAEQIFKRSADLNFPMYLGVFFHEFKHILLTILIGLNTLIFSINRNSVNPFFWMRSEIMNVVEERKKHPELKKRDYVQILLDTQAKTFNIDEEISTDKQIQFSEMHIEKKMSTQEINMNLVLFLLAGYETSSTSLSYVTYVLVNHPEEQEKLLNEIEEHIPRDSEDGLTYENIQKLKYMDMFIKEVLRMYPIGNSVINRRCMHETTINGIHFPSGLTVQVDVMSIHFDRDLWGPEDPLIFYPQRFATEIKRHPAAFLGFGLGPKNCIGMKFALFEIKIAMIKILRQFEIIKSSRTPEKLEYIEGIVRSPKNPIPVIFKKRF